MDIFKVFHWKNVVFSRNANNASVPLVARIKNHDKKSFELFNFCFNGRFLSVGIFRYVEMFSEQDDDHFGDINKELAISLLVESSQNHSWMLFHNK